MTSFSKWMAVACSAFIFSASSANAAITLTKDYLNASEGPVVLGEWNSNFDEARRIADEQNIPMVVFFGGISCGLCETLQLACLTDEFVSWQSQKKLVMVFTTESRSDAMKFARPLDSSGFPFIATYWNRNGVVPEKGSEFYQAFTARNGEMPEKGGTLANQLIRSIERVAGAYPYAGGDFLLSSDATCGLEVEVGYPSGRKVVVPLTRSNIPESYVNRLVCGTATSVVNWAAHETEKFFEVEIPDGLPASTRIPLALLSNDGFEQSTSAITVVEKQPNSLRNPSWLGEPFEAGEWTMDYDKALSRMKSGEFRYALLYFSGVLWCPHCQGLEEGVLRDPAFSAWCRSNDVALVEFDNPRRSDPKVPANDYDIREASGAPPTLLRYGIGSNSYAGKMESGASYISRKGIAVGDAQTPETAEFILQRNRRLGYEWGEGTYCAPGTGRNGYPTIVLLKQDGTVAGRFNRFAEGYNHPLEENMSRFDELLRLAEGEGEASCYPQTSELSIKVGGDSVAVDVQVNAVAKYFRIDGKAVGRVDFSATGASAENPIVLSVVTIVSGNVKTLASGEGCVSWEFDGTEQDCFLKVEAFRENRAYGRDTQVNAYVSSALVLEPAEATRSFSPEGRSFMIEVKKGARYRLEGFVETAPEGLRDDGLAADGGRYYVAERDGVIEFKAAAEEIRFQIWNPGAVAFDHAQLTVFEFERNGTVCVSRTGGSSGAVSVKVCVVDGDAKNGLRYDWDNETVLSWSDGEAGTRKIVFPLKDTGILEPNEMFVLQLCDAHGSAAESVSSECCEVMLSDIDTPILQRQRYDLQMFATLDAASALPPQTAYNVVDGKVSFKKVSGKLPRGVKLVYDNGKVSLSGVPSKTGTYEYTFRMAQKQNGSTVYGPDITISVVVVAPNDTASGGNALMGHPIKTTIPLYGIEDGIKFLKGVIQLTISTKNKISAKYSGIEKKSVTFKGCWHSMSNGFAEAAFESKGKVLGLTLDPEGSMTAAYSDPVNEVELSSGAPLLVGTDDFASPFSGKYTLSMEELASDDPAGWGYVVVKSIASSGKVSWSGMLANGQSISGTSYLTIDADGYAVLPVFRRKSKDYISAAVLLRPYGSTLEFPRAAKIVDGTRARWEHIVEPVSRHDCMVRGSWYDPSASLADLCFSQFADTRLRFYPVLGGWISERYGIPKEMPSGVEVDITDKGVEVAEKPSDLKIKFSRFHGIVSGSIKIMFGSKKVKASFKGVVLPGWHDCGCEVVNPADPFKIDESQQFAVGAAWISDKIEGRIVKRGFPVVIGVAGN